MVTSDSNVVPLRVYDEEVSQVDIVGESKVLEKVIQEFGLRISRGTALTYHYKDGKRYNVENKFRNLIKGYKKCIEIGTFRGLSTALLAHYCEKVITIDVNLFSEAMYLWKYLGVYNKILYCTVDSDVSKQKVISETGEFDFAFIDGLHTYNAVKSDFESLKQCGTVLFHDYVDGCYEVKKFIDELPKEEVTIDVPFALWKQLK